MSDYPVLHYSKKEVRRAGEALGSLIPWSDADRARAIEVFNIAYDWRASHAYPMRRIRQELAGKIHRQKWKAITAARMKRMGSIRKKLRQTTNNLDQMQDIGGCRAILEGIDQVRDLVEMYRQGASRHLVRFDRSYLEGNGSHGPKPGGYRGHHFVLDYQAEDESELPFAGRRVEVQIRTRLQHIWATAVETAGLIRGEDLKGGNGDPSWLQLLELMSSEFAVSEGCPIVPGTPHRRRDRHKEIASLNEKLNAVDRLSVANKAFRTYDINLSKNASAYLIEFDRAQNVANVRGYSNPSYGRDDLVKAERRGAGIDAVLVEVDRVKNLRAAYPNYFLDVREFTNRLRSIVGGTAPESEDEKPRRVLRTYDLATMMADYQRRQTNL